MKKIILLSLFFTVTATLCSAQIQTTAVSNDTIENPGQIILIDGDEVINPDMNNNLDSLLSIWYLQRALRDTMDISFEENYLIADLPDSIYIERLKRIPTLIDLPYNHVVRNSIILYTQKISEKSEMILGLCQYYMPMIEEVFDGYGLPLELRAMAVIESAMNPRAVSKAKAKGMWQFMYRTALSYNLKINSFVDERLDPVASTDAAARFLRDLHGIFGDWSLAIAAYNCGAGNVNKAIRRAGGKRSFWDIYPYLPRETRGYVPAFIAATYLLEYHKEHRLSPKTISMPSQVDTFIVNKMLHFEQISEVIGISVDELRDFNPQYMHNIIPGTSATYSLSIPSEYTSLFAEKENEIYKYKDSIYFNQNIIRNIAQSRPETVGGRTIHRVQRGETLGSIALKYRVKVSDLQYWNNLGKKTQIRAGQKLVVNAKSAPKATTATTTTAAAAKGSQPTPASGTHTVKKGESLWSIAQLYDDISFYDLMQINGFTKTTKIKPGDKIKIKK